MPTLIGGILALVALAAGILSHVEPVASIERALLAFVLGWMLTHVWYVFFTVRIGGAATDAPSDEPQAAPAGEGLEHAVNS
jgi:hypothetical protein